MRPWSIVIHSETPSSRPTNDSMFARLNVGCAKAAISRIAGRLFGWQGMRRASDRACARRRGMVAELLAQHFLVELADAGPGQRLHEHDLVRHRVTRDHPLARVVLQGRLDLAVADRRALLAHHDCERPFGPLRIRNADDGGFAHARMLEDEVLDVERRDPFAAGLDDVLEAVRDLDVSVGADDANAAGVQPSAEPQLFRVRGIAQIALRQPRRPRHDLARRGAVRRNVPHLGIDDPNIDQWNRASGLDPHFDLTIHVPPFAFGSKVSQSEHGTGLGHAISGGDVDAALHGLLGQGPRQCRAADDDLPAVEHSSAALGWARIICRMVGTQWENVTFSRAIRSSTRSGEYLPR